MLTLELRFVLLGLPSDVKNRFRPIIIININIISVRHVFHIIVLG